MPNEIIAEFSISEQESIEANFEMEQNKGTRDHDKLINRDKPNQHSIGSITGLEEELEKTFFPIIVNNSGDNAPSYQPQSIDEKYLCKNENKMYIVGEGWKLKEDVINTADFNSSDGSISNFALNKGAYVQNAYFDWGNVFNFKFHFKLNQEANVSSTYYLFYSTYQNVSNINYITWLTIKNGKLHLTTYKGNYIFDSDIVQASLQTNIDYYLHIIKEGSSLRVVLSIEEYDKNIVEDNSFVAQNNSIDGEMRTSAISFGCYVIKNPSSPGYSIASSGLFSIGTIYLTDSYGETVEKSASSLIWIQENLEDKKIYLDIMNSILFFYISNNLISIGG